jgi:hypothetical protein
MDENQSPFFSTEWVEKNINQSLKNAGINLEDLAPEVRSKLEQELNEEIPSLLQSLSNEVYQAWKSGQNPGLKNRKKDLLAFSKEVKKMWGQEIDSLEYFVIICRETGSEFNQRHRLVEAKNNNLVFEATTHIHARACQVAFEIVALLKSGYADGAYARWRTLHELDVNSRLIIRYGNDLAERYLQYINIELYHMLKEYKDLFDFYNEEEYREYCERKNQLCAKYGPHFEKSYGWAAHLEPGLGGYGFSRLEKLAGIAYLRPSYRKASHNVHAAAIGEYNRLGLTDTQTEQVMLAGPSLYGIEIPGEETALSFFSITKSLFRSIAPDTAWIIVEIALSKFYRNVENKFYPSSLFQNN